MLVLLLPFSFSYVFFSVKCLLVYDASGYYSGNIYGGNNYRLGDPELCKALNYQVDDRDRNDLAEPIPTIHENAQNFSFHALANVPFQVQAVNVRYRMTIIDALVEAIVVHQLACMPKSCSHYDLTQVMSFANISHLRNNLIMQNAQLIDLRIIQQTYDFREDVAFVIFM